MLSLARNVEDTGCSNITSARQRLTAGRLRLAKGTQHTPQSPLPLLFLLTLLSLLVVVVLSAVGVPRPVLLCGQCPTWGLEACNMEMAE